MALSGSFYTYPVGSFGLYCEWRATQDIPGYYSDVTVTVYLQHYAISVGARNGNTIKCAGEVYTYSTTSLSYASGSPLTKTLLGSHTFRVYHDAGGGVKTVPVSASWTFNGTYSNVYVGTITASTSISLNAIQQQSAISSVSVDANNQVTVFINRYVSTFTHEVKFKFGSRSYTLPGVATSGSYTIPLEWLDAIPNSLSGSGTVEVTTYLGLVRVGDVVTGTFTVSVPESVVPNIGGISWTKNSAEPSDWPITQSVSTGVMSMTGVSGVYGSTIKSYSLTFAGISSNSPTLVVDNISSYGAIAAVARVTDSRGRSFTKTVDFTVARYGKPSLSVLAYRSNEDGHEDAVGEYMSLVVTASVTSVADNALEGLAVEYKKHSDYFYTKATIEPDVPWTVAASSDYTWDWVVSATDKVNTVTVQGSVATGTVILDILADGTGVKFGGVAEESGLHSNWDFQGKHVDATKVTASLSVESPIVNATDLSGECVYAGQLLINNEDVVDYVIEQGVEDIWFYRKWSSGFIEMWGKYDFTMTKVQDASYAITGDVLYPFTLESVIGIQVTNDGGYLVAFKINSSTNNSCNFLYWSRGDVGVDGVPQTLHIHITGTWK